MAVSINKKSHPTYILAIKKHTKTSTFFMAKHCNASAGYRLQVKSHMYLFLIQVNSPNAADLFEYTMKPERLSFSDAVCSHPFSSPSLRFLLQPVFSMKQYSSLTVFLTSSIFCHLPSCFHFQLLLISPLPYTVDIHICRWSSYICHLHHIDIN